MTNLTFKFNAIDKRRFQKVIKDTPVRFFRKVKELWTDTNQEMIGQIIKNQLSGRRGGKGLNRISGNAARALTGRTWQTVNDIRSSMFLLNRGGVKKYLPIHDKSWKGSRTIKHPGGTPYIVTSKGATWMKKDGKYPRGVKFTKAHDIRMPQRTNIIEAWLNEGGRRRRRDVKTALRLAFNG